MSSAAAVAGRQRHETRDSQRTSLAKQRLSVGFRSSNQAEVRQRTTNVEAAASESAGAAAAAATEAAAAAAKTVSVSVCHRSRRIEDSTKKTNNKSKCVCECFNCIIVKLSASWPLAI